MFDPCTGPGISAPPREPFRSHLSLQVSKKREVRCQKKQHSKQSFEHRNDSLHTYISSKLEELLFSCTNKHGIETKKNGGLVDHGPRIVIGVLFLCNKSRPVKQEFAYRKDIIHLCESLGCLRRFAKCEGVIPKFGHARSGCAIPCTESRAASRASALR